MNVSVVITCWNGQELLKKNLPKVIEASQNPANRIIEIIVVDDASTDDSVKLINRDFPEVRTITHQHNLGYGAVCNTGIKAARGELVAILNLDVVPDKDFLVDVLPSFKDEKVFSVSFNEGKFGPGKVKWENGLLNIIPSVPTDKTTLTDWPSGGSSLFRKNIWGELGGADKLFLPFYFEDMDLGFRAKKAGYKCLWEPRSKVKHDHEATINESNFSLHQRKNNISLIKERNYLLLNWKYLKGFKSLISHLFWLIRRIFKNPAYIRVIFAAIKRRLICR